MKEEGSKEEDRQGAALYFIYKRERKKDTLHDEM